MGVCGNVCCVAAVGKDFLALECCIILYVCVRGGCCVFLFVL